MVVNLNAVRMIVASTGIEEKVSSIANTLGMLMALTDLNTSFRSRWKT
jgi:hypothetical protein